ncbi:aldehyde dehydrogenase family protein [Pedococcus sp. 5OH_020]|uniref:aldehyde dehydrogenase family protein n=1 Tax=Pedococcus sp. 5OH_020 TaxID=2989814 RepID=UPI0022E9B6F5|nr:aldehyde dehydrogenase family protein [Pedococcus sp. 5OH_020]
MSSIRSYSPQDPTDLVVEAPAFTSADVARSISRGAEAHHAWSRASPHERAGALEKAASALQDATSELSRLIVREVGKPVAEATAEVARGVAILKYFAAQAFEPDGEVLPGNDGRTLLMVRRRSHGLVGLITPWNFPMAIPLWKAAPALAFGNSVILKPAEQASAVALRLADMLQQWLPQHVFQVATGGPEAGTALVDGADCVSFTGSAAVGRQVARSAVDRGIPVQCEMGGQNASIVMPDAAPEPTAASIAAAAMGYAGQKCTATSRVIVVGDRPDFAEAFVAAVRALSVGDPSDPAVEVGPLITETARDRAATAVATASNQGARVLFGGGRMTDRQGHFMTPAVVSINDQSHPIAQEEVFGPVCALLTADDLPQAIDAANAVKYGLAASVYTSDLAVALDAVDGLDVGMVKVNQPTTGVDFYAPFGGNKASSYGPREQGKAAQVFYTSTRTISMSGVRP